MKLETENVQESEASAELIRELMADDGKRGLEENVASVEVLPIPIPIANEV